MNSYMRITIRVVNQGQRELAQVATQVEQITKKSGRASAALSGFMNIMRSKAGAVENFGKNMQWTGRQLEYRFTLPIIAAGTAATKWAMDNERALTRVRKVYGSVDFAGDVNKDVDKLGKAFRILSDLMGINQADVIDLGAAWAQAGATGAALANVVRLTAEAMILGDLSAEKASQSLIAIQQQYNLNAAELRSTLALLNVVENESAISMGGLIEGFTRAAATARIAGVDTRHLAAQLATLAPAAGSAEQAGNALKTIYSRLLAPTKQARDLLHELGIDTGSVAWQSDNAAVRLEALAVSFDSLTGSQKVQAATTLGTRFQISKFAQLMADLINPMGTYQKMLHSTGDEAKNAAVFQKELGTFLASQPQTFKILTTQIKNMLTEAIVPMLPAFMSALKVVRQAFKWFTNLSPSMQKFAMTALLVLAAMGPVIAYLGSFIILGAQVMKVLDKLGFGYRRFEKINNRLGQALEAAGRGLKILAARAVDAIQWMARLAYRATTQMWKAIIESDALAWAKRQAIAVGAWVKERAIFAARWAWLIATEVAGWVRVVALAWAGAARRVIAQGAAWVAERAIFAARWAWLIAAEVAGWAATAAIAAAGSIATAAATVGWIPLAAVAVGTLAVVFRKQIGKMVSGVAHSMGQLPGIFARVLRAVFMVVKSAVMAIWKAMSYLNPFARHSPSLVEQVTKGVAVIAERYASLRGASSVFRTAAADFRAFLAATSGARSAQADSQYAAQRKDIVAVAPGAGPASDALYASIKALKVVLANVGLEFAAQERVVSQWADALKEANAQLDEANIKLKTLTDTANSAADELAAAQQRLDDFADTQIQGSGAMADAIFANEMAQKSLRLEMLRMEEAGGTIDDIRSRLAALAGDLEQLNGERTNLRLAGAGSDVLGPIDQQIAALENSRSAMESQIGSVSDLGSQLEALQRQGEILDLTESLKFDPLRRQIDQAAHAMKELPFAEILAGVQRQRAEVERLTPVWEAANAAVKAQQGVVDQLTASRDDLQSTYDMELAKLTQLGDAYDGIEQQIRDMVQALDEFASLASAALGAAGGAGDSLLGGAGDFPDVGGSGAALQGGDLDKLVADWQKEMDGMFDSVDIFESFKKKWREFKQWLQEELNKLKDDLHWIWEWIKREAGDAWQSIKDTAAGIWDGITSYLTGKWTEIKDNAAFIFRSLGGSLAALWQTIKDAAVAVWSGIGDYLRGKWTEIKDNAAWIFRSLGGSIAALWQTIKDAASVAWEGITTALSAAWNGLRDIALGVFDGIKESIGSVWSAITSAAETAWNGIGSVIASGINVGIDAINALGRGVNAVSGALGLGFRVGTIDRVGTGAKGGGGGGLPKKAGFSLMAEGGVVPYDLGARGPFKTNGARAIVGEGNAAFPEFVIPTDPRFRGRARELFGQLGQALGTVPQFALGGLIPDSIKGAVGGIGGAVKGAVGGAVDLAGKGIGALTGLARQAAVMAIFGPVHAAVNALASRIPLELARRSVQMLNDGAYNWAKGAKNGALVRGTAGGSLVNVGEGGPGHDEAIIPLPNGFKGGLGKTLNFHGDLVFPNIKSGDDAKTFIDNLEALAG